ncbi:hypothetical protein ACQP2Y_15485 [Actinoplanes sp. CA-051413]|uniref:hypothetical protein n=1 Tax=Actinoplanes sp. CA-051413 TaxID=3239899 RepID=UPI003D96E0A9
MAGRPSHEVPQAWASIEATNRARTATTTVTPPTQMKKNPPLAHRSRAHAPGEADQHLAHPALPDLQTVGLGRRAGLAPHQFLHPGGGQPQQRGAVARTGVVTQWHRPVEARQRLGRQLVRGRADERPSQPRRLVHDLGAHEHRDVDHRGQRQSDDHQRRPRVRHDRPERQRGRHRERERRRYREHQHVPAPVDQPEQPETEATAGRRRQAHELRTFQQCEALRPEPHQPVLGVRHAKHDAQRPARADDPEDTARPGDPDRLPTELSRPDGARRGATLGVRHRRHGAIVSEPVADRTPVARSGSSPTTSTASRSRSQRHPGPVLAQVQH